MNTPRPKFDVDNSRLSLNHYGYSRDTSFRTPNSSFKNLSNNSFKSPSLRGNRGSYDKRKNDSSRLYTPETPKNKPTLNLFDPSNVPRSRNYYEVGF